MGEEAVVCWQWLFVHGGRMIIRVAMPHLSDARLRVRYREGTHGLVCTVTPVPSKVH